MTYQKNFHHMWSSVSRLLPVISSCVFNLQALPSFTSVCGVPCRALLCDVVATSDRLLLPSRVRVCPLNSREVLVVWGSQVSSGAGRGEGFVKKSRNSSGWQMKSVHSSKAAPYRQPVEQSQAVNEGQDNGGALYWTPPIENWRDGQKGNTICLTVGEELSFYPPRLQSFIYCAKFYR